MKKAIIFSIAGVIIASGVFFEKNFNHTGQSAHPKTKNSIDDRVPAIVKYGTPIRVARVIDGDTIELDTGDRLRYIGIDTPEEVDPRKPVQCFAREAALKNKELVEGKNIIFYNDISERDQYGRLLGFVYLENGTFINRELVRQGYAFAYPYPPDISLADPFRKDEIEAREHQRGLWAGCNISKTKHNREQTSPTE